MRILFEVTRTRILGYTRWHIRKLMFKDSHSAQFFYILNAFYGDILWTAKKWACFKEKHVDGGKHYHIALKLIGTRIWGSTKNYIYNWHKISVNFATKNGGYVAAYRYACDDKPLTVCIV